MSLEQVFSGDKRWHIEQADCLEWLAQLPERSVDLCFFSPPYEQARLYLENGKNMRIARNTEEWVAWMVEVFRACLRVTKGLVACVCEGQTKQFRYSCGPALLMADLHRVGVHLRKPPIFHRVGIPGSGGPDWLRNDWEWIISATNGGKLPWSDNTAMGHAPKWAPGGEMSHRLADGARVNRNPFGVRTDRPVGTRTYGDKGKYGSEKENYRAKRRAPAGASNGDMQHEDSYEPPALANPGNIIHCKVGGGLMGHDLAHANEAPFPESLCDFFVLSFAPPGGIVLDPFSGSGTTIASAVKNGRRGIGCDLRESQVQLVKRRMEDVQPTLFG